MKLKNNSLQVISDFIKNNDNFLIIGHIDPDGDAVGSIMAFKFVLDQLNKKSLLLLHSDISKEYRLLFKYLNKNSYLIYNKNLEIEKILSEYKNVVVLDTANLERLGKWKSFIKKFNILNIDHHYDNPKFGLINYVNPDISAVGEILYNLFLLNNIKIDKKIGMAVALAVLADTGSLKYSNSNSDTFRLIADLKDKGIDIVKINRFLESFPSLEYLKLLGNALANIEIDELGKVAWLSLTKNEIEKSEINIEQINNLVNYPRDIKGIEVGISFIEKEKDFIDISFRSHNYLDVSKVAQKFNGGGHPRASGAKIKGKLNQVVLDVLKEVKKYV
ncbi:MAG: bifunctional oligoribonuclease/PAP phosphatase NrnA [Halanaerobiales bacterium]|nr:bifunctional oligoribonuclease/PAP phosphatase NrnA [Halanaerobiales bacterium]